MHFSCGIDSLTSGFALTLADHFTLADGFDLTLENDFRERAKVELVSDLRDFVPDPNTIVRPSHPFGLTLAGNTLYVVDAAMNTVVEVNVRTGRAQTLFRFAPLQNPTPVGPPFIDAVPNSIRRFGDQLLVTLLTGFPFPPGLAEVRSIDPATRSGESFITGLTSAIDVLPVRHRASHRFFVLEFSTNQLMQAPGRVLQFDSPQATPVVIADNLITPTSMAFDRMAGELFVTEIFTGRIIQVQVR